MLKSRAITFAVSAFLFPVSAWAQEAAEHAADHGHEGGGSMPQLDPTYYPSQFFWLAVTGIILYALLAKVALPRVARIIEARDAQAQHDLEQAYKLKQQAENLKIDYTRALRDADERSAVMIDEAVKEMKERQSAAIQSGLAKANEQVAAAELSLRKEKASVMDAVDTMAKDLSAQIANILTGKRA